jgi:indole-3-glycerol phosphate synthase
MPSLDKRQASMRRDVEARRKARPLEKLQEAVSALPAIRPFTEAIGGEEISFVQRVKHVDCTVVTQTAHGEVDGLAGGIEIVTELAGKTRLSLLLTDMVVDGYQLYEARLAGAGGAVLIAAGFDEDGNELADLYALAADLGLDVIVEVADEEEIERVLEELDPDSFLIRNRDAEGELDLEHTYSLLEEVPAGKTVLSQGGVRERDQVEELERAGVDAVILGAWALAGDLPATLRTLRGDAR